MNVLLDAADRDAHESGDLPLRKVPEVSEADGLPLTLRQPGHCAGQVQSDLQLTGVVHGHGREATATAADLVDRKVRRNPHHPGIAPWRVSQPGSVRVRTGEHLGRHILGRGDAPENPCGGAHGEGEQRRELTLELVVTGWCRHRLALLPRSTSVRGQTLTRAVNSSGAGEGLAPTSVLRVGNANGSGALRPVGRCSPYRWRSARRRGDKQPVNQPARPDVDRGTEVVP